MCTSKPFADMRVDFADHEENDAGGEKRDIEHDLFRSGWKMSFAG
jgi:hypothetical protein